MILPEKSATFRDHAPTAWRRDENAGPHGRDTPIVLVEVRTDLALPRLPFEERQQS
jgi:hypothetical protein